MNESTLNLELDLRQFLQEVISDTLQGRANRPEPVIVEYLLGLLEDSARGEGPVRDTLGTPLVVQLSQALQAPPSERFGRLRKLGDGVLLLGGLYEPHLKHAGLPDRYVIALGQKAYSAASNLMVPSAATPLVGDEGWDLLARLAEGFRHFVALLRDVSDTLVARSARSARDVAHLWERWVEKRTDHLTRLLQGQGIPAAALQGTVH